MRFDLKEKNGFIPDLEYGNRGEELICFIPDNYSWNQVNYGQGEGQVKIGDCEWGFYYSSDSAISIKLHEGVIELNEALDFIESVKSKVFGNKSDSVTIRLVGEN